MLNSTMSKLPRKLTRPSMVNTLTADKSDSILPLRGIEQMLPVAVADREASEVLVEIEIAATQLSTLAKTTRMPRKELLLGSRAEKLNFDTHIVYLFQLRKV